jgi:serine/threonine protein phosphatase PrpC
VKLQYAVRASQGGRSYQEDSAVVWQAPNSADRGAADGTQLLAILADGMGGHAGGAIASDAVCKNFKAQFVVQSGTARDRLKSALDAANGAIGALVGERPNLRGMGATLIGVAFDAGHAHWVSVGDSPLYLYRRGEMARLNEDHSMAPVLEKLVEAGRLDPEEARDDPRRHLLRSAVVGEDLDLVDLAQEPWPLHRGDVVVLASDGLNSIADIEIARVIAAFRKDGPEATAEALIQAVADAGEPHQDNTTVVVVTVGE